jgi:hypothetical protein
LNQRHLPHEVLPDDPLDLEAIVNYATPGYATAVFVVTQGIRRIRTTAESHRRIAIIEVMGRQGSSRSGRPMVNPT